MSNELVETNQFDDKIATSLNNYSSEQVAVIKNTVAKGTTNLELAYFLQVAQSVALNPFNKEIWCYKDTKGNLLVFAGRDGHLSNAQKRPNFAGMRSCEIRENDEFVIDVANKEIKHTVKGWGEERGKLKGAYAIVFRKDGEPTIELADFARYNKGYNTWKTHPEEMIKKVAETHALKKAFGMSGVQSEYEWEVKNNVAIPLSSSMSFDLLGDVEMLREGKDFEISNRDFLERICAQELGKRRIETPAEKEHIRKVIFESGKYDISTAKIK